MNKKGLPFWKNKQLSPEEKNEIMKETCRRLYKTDDGKIALGMLLTDLKMFAEIHTEKDMALNNYAKFFIRERLGVRDTKALTDFIAETAVSAGG